MEGGTFENDNGGPLSRLRYSVYIRHADSGEWLTPGGHWTRNLNHAASFETYVDALQVCSTERLNAEVVGLLSDGSEHYSMDVAAIRRMVDGSIY